MRGRGSRPLALALLVVLVLVLAGSPVLAQCPLCKSVLTQSPEGRQISGSFNDAILVLLFAPYLVLATVALILFRVPIAREIARRARPFLPPR